MRLILVSGSLPNLPDIQVLALICFTKVMPLKILEIKALFRNEYCVNFQMLIKLVLDMNY